MERSPAGADRRLPRRRPRPGQGAGRSPRLPCRREHPSGPRRTEPAPPAAVRTGTGRRPGGGPRALRCRGRRRRRCAARQEPHRPRRTAARARRPYGDRPRPGEPGARRHPPPGTGAAAGRGPDARHRAALTPGHQDARAAAGQGDVPGVPGRGVRRPQDRRRAGRAAAAGGGRQPPGRRLLPRPAVRRAGHRGRRDPGRRDPGRRDPGRPDRFDMTLVTAWTRDPRGAGSGTVSACSLTYRRRTTRTCATCARSSSPSSRGASSSSSRGSPTSR
ncbi:hypothetical protein SBRY_70355 [Actinacidiphila bryophytorum]|uniref:Uncharacterized protein n=1 Tax=Actinacidiphila bryophytorum TaxID=1436133 RepID=A0A9W4H7I4_9ACTN|nr:hypothetical protein SBRY_70355 [Actinacidiphila bryophytorum]